MTSVTEGEIPAKDLGRIAANEIEEIYTLWGKARGWTFTRSGFNTDGQYYWVDVRNDRTGEEVELRVAQRKPAPPAKQ
jgi:hypothetical protein